MWSRKRDMETCLGGMCKMGRREKLDRQNRGGVGGERREGDMSKKVGWDEKEGYGWEKEMNEWMKSEWGNYKIVLRKE